MQDAADTHLKPPRDWCAVAIALRLPVVILLAVGFKAIGLAGLEPVAVSDLQGYMHYVKLLRGEAEDSYFWFVYPPGYGWYIYAMTYWFGLGSHFALMAVPAALCVLMPIALFVLFDQTGPSRLAPVVASLAYVMATTMLRYEPVLSSEALSAVLLAGGVIVGAFLNAPNIRLGWRMALGGLLGAILILLALVRPQFMLVHYVFILAALGAVAIRTVFSLDFRLPSWRAVLSFVLPWAAMWIAFTAGQAAWSYRNYRTAGIYAFVARGGNLNHATAYIDTVPALNPTQEILLREIVARRAVVGPVNTLTGFVGHDIMARHNISVKDYLENFDDLCARAIAANRPTYLRTAVQNVMIFFAGRGDGLFGSFHLVNLSQNLWPWKPFAWIMAQTEIVNFRPSLLLLFLTFGAAIGLGYARDARVQYANLLCVGLVLYAALTAALAQNAEMVRYRATTEWLWFGHLMWATVVILQAAICRIGGGGRGQRCGSVDAGPPPPPAADSSM